MENLELLIDLHIGGSRQGPGGEDETRLAIELSGLKQQSALKVADIGCGTGASTLVLASELDAEVTAVDFLSQFLSKLRDDATQVGLDGRIHTCEASMEALPFEDGELDGIWSEGAIYSMGFESGIQAWRRFLKPGGIIAVSELTWLTDARPDALTSHWNNEYPEVGTASDKIAVLERLGFAMLGYFPLPARCWMDNYYDPMRQRFSDFLERHGNSTAASELVTAEENEIALYESNQAFVSYGYYIARKVV